VAMVRSDRRRRTKAAFSVIFLGPLLTTIELRMNWVNLKVSFGIYWAIEKCSAYQTGRDLKLCASRLTNSPENGFNAIQTQFFNVKKVLIFLLLQIRSRITF
jgi:hypothetical protein